MGLAIEAYGKLKKVDNPKLNEYGYPLNRDINWNPSSIIEWTESVFPGRCAGLTCDTTYSWSQEYSFTVGGYGFYNEWRDSLYDFASEFDFDELINFSDCEGILGPKVCKKLYNDFERNLPRATEFALTLEEADDWLSTYTNWMTAFQVASDNGAVVFC